MPLNFVDAAEAMWSRRRPRLGDADVEWDVLRRISGRLVAMGRYERRRPPGLQVAADGSMSLRQACELDWINVEAAKQTLKVHQYGRDGHLRFEWTEGEGDWRFWVQKKVTPGEPLPVAPPRLVLPDKQRRTSRIIDIFEVDDEKPEAEQQSCNESSNSIYIYTYSSNHRRNNSGNRSRVSV